MFIKLYIIDIQIFMQYFILANFEAEDKFKF